MEKLAYSVNETAELLGVSGNTVRKEIRLGNLKYKQVCGRKIIPRHCLREYLQDTGNEPTTDGTQCF